MTRPKNNLIGVTSGKLKVISEVPHLINDHRYFNCECECGNYSVVAYSHIKTQSVKSCGCLLNRRWTQSPFFKGIGEISYSWWRSHVLRATKKSGSRQVRRVTVTIHEAWELFLKQDKKCALSGLPLVFSNKRQRDGIYNSRLENTASLDRIDNSKDYTIDNVQWVHKHINFMKHTHSSEYFIELCKKVSEFNK